MIKYSSLSLTLALLSARRVPVRTPHVQTDAELFLDLWPAGQLVSLVFCRGAADSSSYPVGRAVRQEQEPIETVSY